MFGFFESATSTLLYRESQELVESIQEFGVLQVRRQIDQKLVFQHFTANSAAAIGVGGSAIRIIPTPVAAVHQFLDGSIPTRQFDQAVEPGVQMPAADVRPHVAHLLLPRSPHFLHVVERFLDGPAFGADFQDRLGVQRRVRAEVRGPVARCMFQQHDAYDTARQTSRRQEGLAASGDLDATAEERDDLPAAGVARALGQMDAVGAVDARSSAAAC